MENQWFPGIITRFVPKLGFKISYDDGDYSWEDDLQLHGYEFGGKVCNMQMGIIEDEEGICFRAM